MTRKILNPTPGVSHEIGFYLGGMEEVREQTRKAFEGMSDDQIRLPAIPGAHAIGALALHIGESEWYWMEMVVSGHKLNDADRRAPFWDVLKDPDGFPGKGYSAEFCLNEIKKIHSRVRLL